MRVGPLITVAGALLALGFLLLGHEWFSMGGLVLTVVGIAVSAGCAISQVLHEELAAGIAETLPQSDEEPEPPVAAPAPLPPPG